MVVLGLSNRSEAVRRALTLLHQEAAEVRVEADYASWYGAERAPLGEVTAGLYADDE
jgi:Arc/MetJ-type ribon-helix-helix transcriptional regulator